MVIKGMVMDEVAILRDLTTLTEQLISEGKNILPCSSEYYPALQNIALLVRILPCSSEQGKN